MVCLAAGKIVRQLGVKLFFERNADFAFLRCNGNATIENFIACEGIDGAHEFAGIAI